MRQFSYLLVVLAGSAALATFAAALRAGVPDTQLAQNHLRQLGISLQHYLIDHSERLDDPFHLWEYNYVTDPIMFWNPGDTDPPPGIILNSVPNAYNSARISFEFATCLRPCDGIRGDEPVIWDNTPDNNGGSFISFVAMDGALETSPPNVSPIPTNVAITRAYLRRLRGAVGGYARNNAGVTPSQLFDVHPIPYAPSPRNFWNPGDSDPMPTDIYSDEPDAINSARISFDYLVADQDWDSMDPETIVLSDNSPGNNAGFGVIVINRRGISRFVSIDPFGDANTDGDIDLADYSKMQNCFTARTFGAILDNTCRVMDWDGDDQIIPWTDQTNLLLEMTGPLSE